MALSKIHPAFKNVFSWVICVDCYQLLFGKCLGDQEGDGEQDIIECQEGKSVWVGKNGACALVDQVV